MQGIGALRYAFSLSPIFNRSGSFSMTMPLDDKIAYSVAKHSTCVVCQRNDEIRWSGPIVSVVRDPAAMTLSLTALGWLDELFHRFVRADEEAALIFTDTIGGDIVDDLVATVNAQTDTDGVVRPTHLGFSQANDTQTRTRAYKRGQNYGQAIQELSDIENGLDIYVDPQTRRISTRPPDAYQDRVGVMFGYGVEPFNLANATQNDDGTNTANRISAVSSGGAVVPADDVNAINAQDTMREDWISLSDVADADIVGAYAVSEVIYRSRGTDHLRLQAAALRRRAAALGRLQLGRQGLPLHRRRRAAARQPGAARVRRDDRRRRAEQRGHLLDRDGTAMRPQLVEDDIAQHLSISERLRRLEQAEYASRLTALESLRGLVKAAIFRRAMVRDDKLGQDDHRLGARRLSRRCAGERVSNSDDRARRH
jgi:hypothetical protein